MSYVLCSLLSVHCHSNREVFLNLQKVKLSYISEEGDVLKGKAEVMSAKQEGSEAVVFTPLSKLYVYEDDMKGDPQPGTSKKITRDAHLLQESEVKKIQTSKTINNMLFFSMKKAYHCSFQKGIKWNDTGGIPH